MKKLLLACVAACATLSSIQAQTAFAESGLWDNWYVGANIGFNSKLTHNPFFTHLNPHLTLRGGKDFTPVIGVMAEFTTFFDDKQFPAVINAGNNLYSHTAIKAFNLDLLANLNFHNLFKGYLGYQRPFEVRLLAGVGLNHVCGVNSDQKNDFIAKIGLDFAFSLDKYVRVKGLEAYIEPALNYNLNRYSSGVEINPNYAAWQLAIGVNYHFNRRHKASEKVVATTYPTPAPRVQVKTTITPVTVEPKPAVVEPKKTAENTIKVTTVQPQPAKQEPIKAEPVKAEPAKEAPVKAEPAKAKPAKTEPAKAKPAKAEPVKTEPAKETKSTPKKPASAAIKKQATTAVTPVVADNSTLPTIRYKKDENMIPDDQSDAVSQVASYMKNHPRAHIIIKGQSARTNAVKNALIRRFGINASRLSTASGSQADVVTFGEK
ncbi:MAG: outer membrane beta-barrel protein [Bacteroidaceae bacterium]|nr:outer membrane beta-barrel protein [Bacteroidaceae bacterium]